MSEPSPSLIDWIGQAVKNYLPQQAAQSGPLRLQNLSGDAGFRQYFRLNTIPPTLAVVAPPATENNAAFLAVAHYLRERGIHAPKVIAYESERGYMVVEDLGSDLLLDHLNTDTVDLLYGEALMLLLRLQQLPPDGQVFPLYSRQKLCDEMHSFSQWFVEGLLDYRLTDAERQMLAETFQHLENSAASQPQVIVHRDFHSRNLVYSLGNAPGVIDFQDAVIGPLTYDLVSLLRDCYIQWPVEQVQRWALAYAGMATDVGLLQGASPEVFLRWFDWMGLQRHIKVLGVFSRLSLRDGKHGYLGDLPLVIHYVRSISRQYAEMSAFAEWFDEQLLPLVQRQNWYSSVKAKSAPAMSGSLT